MLGTDKYAYKSAVRDVNPLQKIFVGFVVMTGCVVFNRWQISLFIFVAMIFLNNYYGKHSLNEIGNMFYIPLGFILVGTLTVIIGIYESRDGLILALKIGNIFLGVTKDSIVKGMNIITKSLGIISSVYFFIMNTTISDFTIAMRKLKVPKAFTELMELVYRFIL